MKAAEDGVTHTPATGSTAKITSIRPVWHAARVLKIVSFDQQVDLKRHATMCMSDKCLLLGQNRSVAALLSDSLNLASVLHEVMCLHVQTGRLIGDLPAQDLKDLFGPFGSVQECRILHRGDDIRGAGALVRMNNVAAASQAILALHGQYPHNQSGEMSTIPLLVRYADSPEEKARKQARKEQLASRQHR